MLYLGPQSNEIDTFLSSVMSAPPRRMEKHPGKVGMLVGASNYVPVYIFL